MEKIKDYVGYVFLGVVTVAIAFPMMVLLLTEPVEVVAVASAEETAEPEPVQLCETVYTLYSEDGKAFAFTTSKTESEKDYVFQAIEETICR